MNFFRQSTVILGSLVIMHITACDVTSSSVPLQQANSISQGTEDSVTLSESETIIKEGSGEFDAITNGTLLLEEASLNLYNVLPHALQGGLSTLSAESQSSTSTRVFSQNHACTETGDLLVHGHTIRSDSTSSLLDFQAEYSDCDDINGNQDITAFYQLSGNHISYELNASGKLGGNGCLLEFEGLEISYKEESSLGIFSMTFKGIVSAQCEDRNFECHFLEAVSAEAAIDHCE